MNKIDYDIINGDCLAEMPKLAPMSVDFVLSDLPYGQTAQEWDKTLDHELMWKGLKRVVKQTTFKTLAVAITILKSDGFALRAV